MVPSASQPPVRLKKLFVAVAGTLAGLTALVPVQAMQLEVGNPDLRLSWDNTVKYSAAWRVRDADADIADNSVGPQANTNDGDLNFDQGADLQPPRPAFRARPALQAQVRPARERCGLVRRCVQPVERQPRGAGRRAGQLAQRRLRRIHRRHREAARAQGRAAGCLRLRQLHSGRDEPQRQGRALHSVVRREPVLRLQRHRRGADLAGPDQGVVGAQLAVQGDSPPGRPGRRPTADQLERLARCLLPVGMAQEPPAGRRQLLQLCRLRR